MNLNCSSKTMANAGGSKNATLTKPGGGAAYAPTKQGNDLDSLMAKFNNSLAIQNLMNNHGAGSSYQGTSSNKSRNTGGNVP
jgi:hypothetical protein